MIHRAIDSEQISGAVRREGAVHEVRSLRLGTWLGKGNDPRYTPTTTFEMFPFPLGLTPDVPAADYADDPRSLAVVVEARRLVELRPKHHAGRCAGYSATGGVK